MVIGCIGTGNVFNTAHLQAYAELSKYDIAGFYDIKKSAAEFTRDNYMHMCKERWGDNGDMHVPEVYNNAEELLEKVDIVDICTPVRYHPVYSTLAAERGVHVMTEKPMARTWIETKHVMETVKKAKTFFQLNDDNLFLPRYLGFKNVIESKQIGDIQSLRLVRGTPGSNRSAWFWDPLESGGGAIMDYGSHAITSAWFLIGFDKEPVEVISQGIGVKDKTRFIQNNLQTAYIDDDAHFKVRFKDPVTGDWITVTIEATWRMPDYADKSGDVNGFIHAEGTEGSITSSFNEEGNEYIKIHRPLYGDRLIPVKSVCSESVSFKNEIVNFLQCVDKKMPPYMPIENAAATIKILNAAQLSEVNDRNMVSMLEIEQYQKDIAAKTDNIWKAGDKISLNLCKPYKPT